MSFILELRDGKIILPEEYFKRYLDVDWFLSGLYNFPNQSKEDEPDHKIFTLWESKNVVLTLIDSLKFQKLTLHNDVSLEYLNNLANMWCAPEWLIKEIEEYKKENDKKKLYTIVGEKELDNCIFKCKICYVGFKLNYNNEDSCKRHRGAFNQNSNKFTCCGEVNSVNNFCQVGYHIPDDYVNIRNSIMKIC